MLYYLPLEPYRERYTAQLSVPLVGWYERNWHNADVDYERVEPELWPNRQTIKTGSVVDAVGRAYYSFNQITKLLSLADQGKLTDADTIFFDDFWTPGMEALPYAFKLMNVRPKMYAYCWAQSVDEFDFTFKMKNWMRHYERGICDYLDGVFVASTGLRDLLVSLLWIDPRKVHVVGLPFDSREVMERMPDYYRSTMGGNTDVTVGSPRKNQVVFSSRWDLEKQPHVFVSLYHEMKHKFPDTRFVVTTSAPKLRSNSQLLLELAWNTANNSNGQFVILEDQTKEQYYQTLCESKVQFNCAKQDWVSFTLLEASVAGCLPVYPNERSFPETLGHKYEYLYPDFKGACDLVAAGLSTDWLFSPDAIRSRKWIHERFDDTWLRILNAMKVKSSMSEMTLTSPYIPYPQTYRRVT